jgi:hypothetical protein
MAVPLRRAGTAVFALILAAFATPTRHAAAAPGAWEWLSARQGPGQFTFPQSPAVGPDGRLYVADGTSSQVQVRDARGQWTIIAPEGTLPGQVDGPGSLCLSGDGTLYVLERGNRRLQARGPGGSWQVIDYPAPITTQPHPVALAADSAGTLFLIDGTTSAMTLWTRKPDGEWQDTGERWPSEAEPVVPSQITADPKGGLYVLEVSVPKRFGGRLRHWSASGGWEQVAPTGTATGMLYQVAGMAPTPQGEIYVSDLPNMGLRIQKRDAQGNWSLVPVPTTDTSASGSLAAEADGELFLTENAYQGVWWRDVSGHWAKIGAPGKAPGQICFGPVWDVDPQGQVYLGQGSGGAYAGSGSGTVKILSGDNRIDIRAPGGAWERVAVNGSAVGQVFNLVGVAASPSGELYAAESDPLSRLQRRQGDGSWSSLGADSPTGGFNAYWCLSSLAVDGQGTAWVAESGYVGNKPAMRLSTRSLDGKWGYLISDTAGLYSLPHVQPDGKGGCYLWSRAETLSDTGEKAWPQHFDGQSWQDLQSLGSVRELGLGPKGELYIVSRDTGELQQVSPQGDRTTLAPPGLGLGQVAPDLQAIRADSFGRVYLCSRAGVQRYTPPSALVRGDVDGDGQVAIADVVLALRVVAGLKPSTPTLELRADVSPAGTGDGTLSIADAIRLLRYLAGLEAGL